MDDYLIPFVDSTFSVFQTMLNCQLKQGEALQNDRFQPQYDVSGVIGLSGEVSGTVILSVEREVALQATQALLGAAPDEVDEEVIDAIGELTNMVAGGAKTKLTTFNMSLALPAVITGRNHAIAFGSRVRPVAVPFQSEWGAITVEVGFVQTPQLNEAIARYRSEVAESTVSS